MPRKRRRRKIKVDKLLELGARAGESSKEFGRLFDSPEDVSQEYIMRLLEGKHQHSYVGQAVIDMARDLTGRKGLPGYEARKAVAFAIQTDPDLIRNSHRPFDVVNRRLFLEKAMNKLSRKEKVFILAFLDGNNLQEIADLMGFSAARASQIWDKVIEKMKAVAES
jgi:RNA polymerase sigma factor (sigma-70 family)